MKTVGVKLFDGRLTEVVGAEREIFVILCSFGLGFCGLEELLAGSKRAMDEDILQIFRSGQQCVVLNLVLAITTDVQGIGVSTHGGETFGPTRHVLSYLMKALVVPKGTPVANA